MEASLHLLGLTLDQQTSSSALSDEMADAIQARFVARNPGDGLLVLSTCARLEFYIDAQDHHAERLHEALGAVTNGCPAVGAMSYELVGPAAVAHLFRVSAGLESPILGDTQILAQLRRAEARARVARGLPPLLTEAVRRALALGREVRRETQISAGGADIGSAVARAIADRGLTFSPVVIVGAGDAAERTLAAFDHAPRPVGILNRSHDRAVDLAERYGATVLDVEQSAAWEGAVFVLTAPAVPAALTTLVDDARCIIDVVPGGAGPSADVNLRDLADWSDPRRLAAVETVADRCDDALADWEAWSARKPFETAVGALYRDLDRLVDDLEAGDAAIAVRSVVRRWLHPHVTAMRDAVTTSPPDTEPIQESV